MGFAFYNTLSRSVQAFVPAYPPAVRIYSCGPTVYDYAHIGNFRSYIFLDILRRALKFGGLQVCSVVNLTDIDDKIIARVTEGNPDAGMDDLVKFTEDYAQTFFADLATLNIEPADDYPRATGHIDEIVDLIRRLQAKGLAYEKEGTVYYSVAGKHDYGKLARLDTSGIRSGTRYDTDEYDKDDIRDFALWKGGRKEEALQWETDLGCGRPGWHVECSAMIHSRFGGGIDIHTGGVDLVFPHHENEIAQSEAAYDGPFVNVWMHCEHLLVDGRKMSKSAGNFHTLRDILARGYDGRAVRMLLMSAHYRQKLNFTWESLDAADAAMRRFLSLGARLHGVTPVRDEVAAKFREEFLQELQDDLNTPRAFAVAFEALRLANADLDAGNNVAGWSWLFREMDAVLALDMFRNSESADDPEVAQLLALRQAARDARDFSESDRLRDLIAAHGYRILDTKDGARLEPIRNG